VASVSLPRKQLPSSDSSVFVQLIKQETQVASLLESPTMPISKQFVSTQRNGAMKRYGWILHNPSSLSDHMTIDVELFPITLDTVRHMMLHCSGFPN